MESKDGTWIMYGVSENDPECLHTVDELIGYIEEVGFLPLSAMRYLDFRWKSEPRRSIGGVKTRRGILGCGVRS